MRCLVRPQNEKNFGSIMLLINIVYGSKKKSEVSLVRFQETESILKTY